jgi:hypothetical protein
VSDCILLCLIVCVLLVDGQEQYHRQVAAPDTRASDTHMSGTWSRPLFGVQYYTSGVCAILEGHVVKATPGQKCRRGARGKAAIYTLYYIHTVPYTHCTIYTLYHIQTVPLIYAVHYTHCTTHALCTITDHANLHAV